MCLIPTNPPANSLIVYCVMMCNLEMPGRSCLITSVTCRATMAATLPGLSAGSSLRACDYFLAVQVWRERPRNYQQAKVAKRRSRHGRGQFVAERISVSLTAEPYCCRLRGTKPVHVLQLHLGLHPRLTTKVVWSNACV